MTVTSSRRRLGALALCISVLALVGAACGGSSGGSTTASSSGLPSGDVAKVGSVLVTQGQFNDLMATAKQSYKTNKKTFPAVGSAAYATVRDQAVSELVQEAEISIGAKNLGITVTQPEVEKALNVIKVQYFANPKTKKPDPAKYAAALKAQGTTDSRVRNQLLQKLLADKITAKLTKGVTVSSAAVSAYYTKNKAQFKVPATRHVRHILVKTKALAETLYKQLKTSDKTFATLAKKYSTDKTSAVNGGDLKMIQKGQTVPTFDAVVFSPKTQVNVVQPPVKSTYGYHLIEALGPIKPATYRKLDTALQTSIKTQLTGTAKQKKISTWLTALKSGLSKEISYAKGYTPAPTATTSTNTITTG
jgi:parvulin-like peptidyl-prolyl isomerase